MKKVSCILLILLLSGSIYAQENDSTCWNFGATVKLGASNIYPGQDDYSIDYPGIFNIERVDGAVAGNKAEEPGYYNSSTNQKFSFALGFSIQYNFFKNSAIEMGVLFNNKSYYYPVYFFENIEQVAKDFRFNSYYLDISIAYQHNFIIGKRSKIRISAGATGCIFLFGDQNNEFFLDMYDNAVVIHRGNYRPIAMMLNGSLEYVFPFFNNHIAVGPTFQIAPMSFTRKENTISSPHRYGGQTYEVSKHYEFKPYFIGAGVTYYLR